MAKAGLQPLLEVVTGIIMSVVQIKKIRQKQSFIKFLFSQYDCTWLTGTVEDHQPNYLNQQQCYRKC